MIVEGVVWNDDAARADEDGRIRSGQRKAAREGLKKPWRLTWTMDHVESQVAAMMRRPGAPRHAQLVLNNPPCQDEPFGCQQILPAILPRGSTVEIFIKDGDTAKPFDKFTGTGEGIGT